MVPTLAVNDREIIATTLRNRALIVPFYSQYASDTSLDRVLNNLKDVDHSNIETYIDAIEHAVLREEFSMAEDLVGVDA
jgi:hypothetical protein